MMKPLTRLVLGCLLAPGCSDCPDSWTEVLPLPSHFDELTLASTATPATVYSPDQDFAGFYVTAAADPSGGAPTTALDV